MAKLVQHELLFLNALEYMVVVHDRLECLLLLQSDHILGRRAVGILPESSSLLNVDYVGRNISECPIAFFLCFWLHIIRELERTCV